MKKSILIIAISFLGGASVFANGSDTKTSKKTKASGEGVITNGFFLNFGVASPSYKYVSGSLSSESQSMGISPSLEIGNQWYFVNKEKIGFGLRVSWFQLGYSSFNYKYDNTVKATMGDLKLLNIAPQFTFAPIEKAAFDLYFSGGLSGYGGSWKIPGQTDAGFGGPGYNYSPGIRLRYSIVSLGFDYTISRLTGNETIPYTLNNNTYTRSMQSARFYLGMQF